ncbi:MAG: hypothetical protein KGO49_05075 [Gammaproteobacteria bacterium]|nr:hypothetical protein [Gammaproteobacteria bacterium]
MNAPRQGLFASIVAISFALHTALIVEGSVHQLASTRDAQGQLLIRQLAEDATLSVARQDTVSLALLANRYSERADVVSLRILAADGHVLATGGSAPSRSGQLFQQILLQDRTQSGQVELTLAEASLGEIIRLQWLPLLLSFFIHVLLWLFYRVVARPKLSWSLSDQTNTNTADEADSTTHEPNTPAVPEPSLQLKTQTAPAANAAPVSYPVILRVAFDDPKSLLETLTPSIAQKYFSLCQKLLEEAIRVLGAAMPNDGEPTELSIVSPFGMEGALVGVNQNSAPALGHLLLLAQLINLLSDAVYRRNRLEKRFALHTRTAITEADDTSDSKTKSNLLIQQAKTNDVLIHASNSNLSRLIIQFSLSAMELAQESKDNTAVNEAMRLNGLRNEQAQLIERVRAQILGKPTE